MRYVFCKDSSVGEAALLEALTGKLQEGSVLWLLSGGSNVAVEVRILEKIDDKLTANLTLMLVDERYGEVGHSDSNWRQLLLAGINPKQATVVEVLHTGASLEDTVATYDTAAKAAFDAADYVIAQLGIGADGHIAGILPESPAASDIEAFAVGYDSDPYRRLTLTFCALQKVNAAYVFAFGENKQQTLHNLEEQIPRNRQPAQVLKGMQDANIYNDQIGGDT